MFLLGVLLLLTGGDAPCSTPPARAGIVWRAWSPSLFAEARREHKFVLLDLEAVWCHWCHVMDEKTYANPQVIALIQSRYIAVRVDQDSRPDLANRYEDYGWPATVVYGPDGGEIVKRSGFFPPEQMASMLQAIIADPSPGPSVTAAEPAPSNGASSLSETERQSLQKQLANGYDSKLGGWGTAQKFLNWDNVEYCLVLAQAGDAASAREARQTLAAQLQLIDPVWGGVDQYSAEGDWHHPHFEKIMQMQAENMRIYAMAYALWKNPADLQTAESIYGYVRHFLTSPQGVVYVSQDADLIPGQHAADYFQLSDAERRKQGIPRVDRHIYARENGWFIEALTVLYSADGNSRYRDEALRAANWIIENRSVPGGGFRHGEETAGPLYLGDSLAMGRAFLALYGITGDSRWLDRAQQAAAFIADRFSHPVNGMATGFATATDDSLPALSAPAPEFDENVSLARFANLLFHDTGKPEDSRMVATAMRFVTAPEVARARFSSVGGLLLADREQATDPPHIAIVGSRSDENAEKLFAAAIAYPCFYKQVEWIDRQAPSSDAATLSYPDLPRAAAYLCANNKCSAPVFDSRHLLELLDRKFSAQASGP